VVAAEVPAVAPAVAHGLPPAAVPVLHLGPLVVTNSMLLSWVVALGLIIVASSRRGAWHWCRPACRTSSNGSWKALYAFLEDILGRDLVKKSFWFFATIFIFILFNNWLGLLPGWARSAGRAGGGRLDAVGADGGVGSLPAGRQRGSNLTAAMSLIFLRSVVCLGVQTQGFLGVIKHCLACRPTPTGLMKLFMIVVFLAVGVLEVVSIAFRRWRSPSVSTAIFSRREHPRVHDQTGPWLGPFLPIPFLFLELLVGLVQALVFCLLTAVFTATMCEHQESRNRERPRRPTEPDGISAAGSWSTARVAGASKRKEKPI